MYIPETSKLQGLSLDVAECYGKPHINAKYTHAHRVDKYTMIPDSPCAICGRMATNTHHHPPKGRGKTIMIGHRKLRPSLFALCGSGVEGCHGMIHSKRIKVTWNWIDDKYAEMWWNGDILKEIAPHSELLYNYGYWDIRKIDSPYMRIGDHRGLGVL